MKRLMAAGYRVAPIGAWGVSHRSGRRRPRHIASPSECDGDRYHPLKNFPKTSDAQSVPRTHGMDFSPGFAARSLFRNPERAMTTGLRGSFSSSKSPPMALAPTLLQQSAPLPISSIRVIRRAGRTSHELGRLPPKPPLAAKAETRPCHSQTLFV